MVGIPSVFHSPSSQRFLYFQRMDHTFIPLPVALVLEVRSSSTLAFQILSDVPDLTAASLVPFSCRAPFAFRVFVYIGAIGRPLFPLISFPVVVSYDSCLVVRALLVDTMELALWIQWR